jgi:flagellar biosynthesis protein FlhG
MSLSKNKLCTIGSGKGGVGKSFLAASMGVALARAGKSVILVDANLAAPNLYDYLGIKAPACTLFDVLEGRAKLPDALIPTPEPQMRYLSCVSDELGMADLAPSRQKEMAECLSRLEADHVLVDGGTGVSFSVLDFFNLADAGLVVVPPDPASMQCSYGFIKNSVYRRVQQRFGSCREVGTALGEMHQSASAAKPWTMTGFLDLLRQSAPETAQGIAAMVETWHPLMLVNMATAEQDQRIAEIIQSAARKFLNVEIQSYGLVHFDPAVRRSGRRTNLLERSDAEGKSARQIRQIALRLTGNKATPTSDERAASSTRSGAVGLGGLNDNIVVLGKDLHIQTEDSGAEERCITTQVFCNGRVVLSTKSEYPRVVRNSHDGSCLAEFMRTQHCRVIHEIETKKIKLQSATA